jgi:hypothetical protein
MDLVIKLNEFFPGVSFLGTRAAGEKIREVMEKVFNDNNTVVLDFDGIENITQGFGDEILGIFTRTHGKKFIKQNIKAVNYGESIKTVLNWVVSYSEEYQKNLKAFKYIVNEYPELITDEQIRILKAIVLKDNINKEVNSNE